MNKSQSYKKKLEKNDSIEGVIYRYKMSNRLLLEFQVFHNMIFESKRLYNFSMKTFDNFDVKSEINKNNKILFDLIIEKSSEILMMLGLYKFNKNNFVIDFHQINSTEIKKEKYNWSIWHEDDFQVTNFPVWTIIYYIRKDKGLRGGNILFSDTKNNKINNIKIDEGDILVYKGNIFHKPKEIWGVGFTDTIKCFIERRI